MLFSLTGLRLTWACYCHKCKWNLTFPVKNIQLYTNRFTGSPCSQTHTNQVWITSLCLCGLAWFPGAWERGYVQISIPRLSHWIYLHSSFIPGCVTPLWTIPWYTDSSSASICCYCNGNQVAYMNLNLNLNLNFVFLPWQPYLGLVPN